MLSLVHSSAASPPALAARMGGAWSQGLGEVVVVRALRCPGEQALILHLQTQGLRPRTPAEPPCKTFRRHPCRRLPSGRHQTISWTVLLLPARRPRGSRYLAIAQARK